MAERSTLSVSLACDKDQDLRLDHSNTFRFGADWLSCEEPVLALT